MNNLLVAIGLMLLVIVFVVIFFSYYQINIIVQTLRQDLYYAAKNTILSFESKDLSYGKYTINDVKAKEIMQYILDKNYTQNEGGSINKVEVTNLDILNKENKIELSVEVKVSFTSVVNLFGKNKYNFKMKENINLSLLQYK